MTALRTAPVTLPGQAPAMPAGLALRGWQIGCARAFTDWADQIHATWSSAPVAPAFLVNAPPGAGKTRAALAGASALFTSGAIERIVVISPARQTATRWTQNLADPARLDTGAGQAIPVSSTATSIRRGRPVPTAVSITFAALTRAAPVLATGIDPDATLVVLDEVHHASDHPGSTWEARWSSWVS